MQDITVMENLVAVKQLLSQVQANLTEVQCVNLILNNRLAQRDGQLAEAQAQIEKLTSELAVAKAGANGAHELELAQEPTPIR